MPVKQTISIRFPNAKCGSILMEDAGLTLNNKGEVVCTSGLVPPLSSGTVVAVALPALADSRDVDLYLPAIHAPPGPRTNCFSGNKGSTKTEIAAERKAAKEAKQKETKGMKVKFSAHDACFVLLWCNCTASGPSTQRLLWLANVDSTIAASALAQSGSLTPEAIAHFNTVE
jgi:hypothetical protein